MSNLGPIHGCRAGVDQINRYGGDRKESSNRRAEFNLINAYGAARVNQS